MAEKWGNWIIKGMPISVLNTAILDTTNQLSKLTERMKQPSNRIDEFEKYSSVLRDLLVSLQNEKESR